MDYMGLAEAMAKVEGFGANKTNRPTRNNNPGDIEYHEWMVNKYKVIGSDGRFAIFSNPQDGYDAMVDILQGPDYRNLTLEQLITKWNDGNAFKPPTTSSLNYLKIVCEETKLPASCIVSKELTNTILASNIKQASSPVNPSREVLENR